MNYYRRYSGDYLRDTARLNLTEHGAYTLLMDYYYTDERPIPADRQELYLMLRAMRPEDRKAVDKVLSIYFTEQPDGFHQKRVDHEIEVSKKARDNGKKGGRPETGSETGSETGTITGLETGTVTGTGTGTRTKKGGGSGHPPTTNLQPPASNHQPPTDQPPPNPENQPPSAARSRKATAEPKTGEVWTAYSEAYRQRWGVEPIRNAKVNGMLARFIERVPVEEAPNVAAFFVRSNRGLYVSAKHAIDLLLRDAESLRTEWATGNSSTDTEARQADRTAATGSVFGKLIKEAQR